MVLRPWRASLTEAPCGACAGGGEKISLVRLDESGIGEVQLGAADRWTGHGVSGGMCRAGAPAVEAEDHRPVVVRDRAEEGAGVEPGVGYLAPTWLREEDMVNKTGRGATHVVGAEGVRSVHSYYGAVERALCRPTSELT